MLKLVHERVELDDTLSWLSTLGGAFSALGDLSITWVNLLELINVLLL